MTAEHASPAVALHQLVSGAWAAQAVYVAAKLGVADHLQTGPRRSTELAELLGVNPGALYRVLRALAGLGVFREVEFGKFELTPMAAYLRTGVPGSLRGVAVMIGEAWHRGAWTEILHSVRTAQPAFEQVHGQPFFAYCQRHPEAAAVFDEAMTSHSSLAADAVLAAYDFGRVRQLVDVAGGHGSLLAAVLGKYPGMRGVLFDLPAVIDGARHKGHLAAAGVADRCELVGGDFFQSVPAGADAYLLKHIVHDWSDEQAVAILKNCRRAVTADGRVLLVETVLPPGNDPFFGKLLDLEMLVMTSGGRERTEGEYRELFAAAGFRLTKVTPTRAPVSLLEGVPA